MPLRVPAPSTRYRSQKVDVVGPRERCLTLVAASGRFTAYLPAALTPVAGKAAASASSSSSALASFRSSVSKPSVNQP